jgi:DnaJ-class molecular chaperone
VSFGCFDSSGESDHIPKEAYKKQQKIPEGERCKSCQGLGWVRQKYSDPRPSSDEYRECFRCDGTGKNKTKNP